MTTVAHTNSPTQRAVDRVLAGEKVSAAARAEGIARPGVSRAVAHYRATGERPTRFGVAPKPRDPKPVTMRGTAPMLRALDLVRGGATLTAAAQESGVDLSNLSRVAKRHGVAVGRRGVPVSPQMERAIVAVLAGAEAKAAAVANNVRADRVRYHVDRHKAALRQRDRAKTVATKAVRRADEPAPHCANPSCPRPRAVNDLCAVCARRDRDR